MIGIIIGIVFFIRSSQFQVFLEVRYALNIVFLFLHTSVDTRNWRVGLFVVRSFIYRPVIPMDLGFHLVMIFPSHLRLGWTVIAITCGYLFGPFIGTGSLVLKIS